MKAIMVMYDSLIRDLLEPYGCDWTKTPNFKRLAERSVKFDQCYVGSMPCMPARRELHTGRANFLHRSWGPLEPYDDSVPEILKKAGIYTHLVSDHQHYWEDGGCTYHTRYSSWDASRGQEGDPWQADLNVKFDRTTVFNATNQILERVPLYRNWYSIDERNRRYMDEEEKTPQAVTFKGGLQFIDQNHGVDNWFLQVETFDPHEPFYVLKDDRDLYPHPHEFVGDAMDDWPPYAKVSEDEKTVEHVRYVYAALMSKCDRYLGKILDKMDEYGLWEDTMLIVNTDHGFLLGEHGWWGKTAMPMWHEISHTPLFVYDPRFKETAGQTRQELVQTVDIAATLLEFFGLPLTKDMEGRPLRQVIESHEPIRDYAVFGYYGSQIDVTDGRYVYMHAAEHPEVQNYEYTLMPTHMRQMFQPEELQNIQLSEPFSFTKGMRLMKIKAGNSMGDTNSFGSMLYDRGADPKETVLVENPEVTERMKEYIAEFMTENDAPEELFERYGLEKQ